MSHRKRPKNSDPEILRTEREILRVEEEILHELRHPHRTASIAIYFGESTTMNSLVLNVGQSSIASIVPLLADGTTPSGGTVSAQVFTLSDPSLTLVANPDGTATITGVAASAGAVSGTAASTVTDTDGAVASFSQAFTVTVNAVTPPPPPTQLTQSTGVSFSTPTP